MFVVKPVAKRRMEDLREEVGVKDSYRRKLVRSWVKWAGHMERMEGERSTKRVEGRRKRGRLRWEDCVKRDLVGLGDKVENATERWGRGEGWLRLQSSRISNGEIKQESNNSRLHVLLALSNT